MTKPNNIKSMFIASAGKKTTDVSFMIFFLFLKKDFIYLFMRDTKREIGREKSRLLTGA